MITLLFVGDIVGRPGRGVVLEQAASLRKAWGLDFVVANAENAAAGAGLTAALARQLLEAGVDVLTLGDHVWDQKGFEHEIDRLERVCRPANLAPACPGRRWVTVEKDGFRLAVATVLGRQFVGMRSACPFRAADAVLAETVGAGAADAALIEIHAEATSEKQAMGWHLDGRALAVLGTHTHVPTADAAVLPGGTAFCCDVGMTGPYASVIGREIEPAVARYLDGLPRRADVAAGDVRLSGARVVYDPSVRRAVSCELVTVRQPPKPPA